MSTIKTFCAFLEVLYERKSTKHYTKFQFLKWGLIQAVVYIIFIFLYKTWNIEWILVILGFLGFIICMEIIILVDCFFQGYQINENGISYYHIFQKKSIKYECIDSIIVSCAFHRCYIGKWVKKKGKPYFMLYPWLTFCYGTPQKILKVHSCTLWSSKVDNMENIIYSFCWNPCVIENMIRNFKGNYYITYSIYARYQSQMEYMIEKYRIDRRRIFIIKDVKANIYFDQSQKVMKKL